MGINKELVKLFEDDEELLRQPPPVFKKIYIDKGYSQEDVDDAYRKVAEELFDDDNPLA